MKNQSKGGFMAIKLDMKRSMICWNEFLLKSALMMMVFVGNGLTGLYNV